MGARAAAIPEADGLDRLPRDQFLQAVAPLFEGAPAFLSRLADARPFGSAEGLISAARAVAQASPEDVQIELLDAHPRIGAAPEELSDLSMREQGTASEADDLADTLASLNDEYEARFGFRYVVFVAGRPRSALVPLLRDALRQDRASELRRGLHDVVSIAADRLARVRGGE